MVATDGLYFQVAYWTGNGPLRVLPPEAGLAYKFDVPGARPPLPADFRTYCPNAAQASRTWTAQDRKPIRIEEARDERCS